MSVFKRRERPPRPEIASEALAGVTAGGES